MSLGFKRFTQGISRNR